jgi:3-oxoacyl-[acyl-carrier protein] reductase
MNKVAIITGATRGIGRGIFHKLASQNVNIATLYHQDKESAKRFEKEANEFKVQYLIEKLNVIDFIKISTFIESVFNKFGRIDYLINNVGNDVCKSLVDLSLDEWHESQDIILNAPFVFCKYVIPIMRQQNYGRIINIGASSKNYLSGHAGYGPFSINKGALILLTQTLALEEIKNGITVNVVAPGSTKDAGVNPEENRIPIDKIPIGRRILIEEIVEAIMYLISDKANAITGQVLNVNGGLSV